MDAVYIFTAVSQQKLAKAFEHVLDQLKELQVNVRKEIIFEERVGMESKEPIQVEAYCGYKTPESPRSFTYRGERHLVSDILEARRVEKMDREEGAVILFRVQADDGNTYQIGYDERGDSWFVET